jgi:hypothetical protein
LETTVSKYAKYYVRKPFPSQKVKDALARC